MIFEYIWQLPQNLLGWLLSRGYKNIKGVEGVKIYEKSGKHIYGVSLGDYIVFGGSYHTHTDDLHEYGHHIQSVVLGPLYLLIVGIPSVLFNVISRISPKFSDRYYERYPENWADDLGGVFNRNERRCCRKSELQ